MAALSGILPGYTAEEHAAIDMKHAAAAEKAKPPIDKLSIALCREPDGTMIVLVNFRDPATGRRFGIAKDFPQSQIRADAQITA